MATITLKNVPPELLQQLKDRAAAHRRSMNSELLTRLHLSLAQERTFDAEAYWRRIDEITAGVQPMAISDDELRAMKNTGRP